jgi:tetratricopeptide (TPR) repeat protein
MMRSNVHPMARALLLVCISAHDGRTAARLQHQHQHQQTAAALYSRGTELLNAGATERALQAFDQAVAIASSSGGQGGQRGEGGPSTYLRVNRGLALARLGREQEALSSYDRALEVDATHRYALYNSGLVLRSMRRLPEAVERLRQAVAVDPANADALHDLCAAEFDGRGADEVLTAALAQRLQRSAAAGALLSHS